jgi:hypothetical protein
MYPGRFGPRNSCLPKKPRTLGTGDGLVEQPLLGPGVIEVVVDHGGFDVEPELRPIT